MDKNPTWKCAYRLFNKYISNYDLYTADCNTKQEAFIKGITLMWKNLDVFMRLPRWKRSKLMKEYGDEKETKET